MRPSVPLITAVLALVAPAPAHAASGWRAPTSGAVTRGFDFGDDPFAVGLHRGADFAAAPGSPVRAACSGRVVVAARIGSSGGVVTVACGRWRVSHLPLARIGVSERARVAAGDPIGTAAPSRVHTGVHLGVRRADDRFGYVDPLRFIRPSNAPPPAGPAGRGRRGRGPAPVGAGRPAPVAAPRGAPVAAPVAAPPGAPVHAPVAAPRPLAPWAAWAGLSALLLAIAGGGARIRAVRTRPLVAGERTPRALAARGRHDLPP